MKERKPPLKVVMFSGGRGTGVITEALLKYPDIELTLLVNAYDDGLSTGLLRRFIPGMLGPSDVRKNVSRFVAYRKDPSAAALLFLIEYRFPKDVRTEEALGILRSFSDLEEEGSHDLLSARERLTVAQAKTARTYLDAFLAYYARRIPEFRGFTFQDMSFGNLLFAGCYLTSGHDFNRAISHFSAFAGTGDRVLNVTQGENLVLVALKQDGRFLHDEATIVGPQDVGRIQEIFLLPDYLPEEEQPGGYPIDSMRYLRNREKLPAINPAAEQRLSEADVIIYGPGTQYSSLLPSYLTSGVVEAIRANARAEKVFIGNIARDHDILGEDATSLVKAFLFNMNRKMEGTVRCQDLVTRFFFQKPEAGVSGESPYVPFDVNQFEYPMERVSWVDFEGDKGKHSASRTVAELLNLIEDHLEKRVRVISQKVSLIVPALNEERTIGKVLRDLAQLEFREPGLEKEIIVVDGGSTDGTYEIACREPGVRAYRNDAKGGRGAALRLGLEKAKGDIVVFFPSDDEYRAEDIQRVVGPLINEEFPVVLGSRAFKGAGDINKRLERVYGSKGLVFLISKYGGVLLSILVLLLHRRYVSDPLTSLKGFNTRVFRPLRFVRNGVDFDMELIAKLSRSGHIILEVPVSYSGRTVKEGKKITVWDGIRCFLTLLRYALWNPSTEEKKNAQGIHRNPRV